MLSPMTYEVSVRDGQARLKDAHTKRQRNTDFAKEHHNKTESYRVSALKWKEHGHVL